MRSEKRLAFTLIELLIVVAIIAILAAIAVPNFLEAQTRARVSRVKADIRALTTGLEMYYMDNRTYPPRHLPGAAGEHFLRLRRLTTPIAYVSAIPIDTFKVQDGWQDSIYHAGHLIYDTFPGLDHFDYDTYNQTKHPNLRYTKKWVLLSVGPDRRYDPRDGPYDATNGTRSAGDIYRFNDTGIEGE